MGNVLRSAAKATVRKRARKLPKPIRQLVTRRMRARYLHPDDPRRDLNEKLDLPPEAIPIPADLMQQMVQPPPPQPDNPLATSPDNTGNHQQ